MLRYAGHNRRSVTRAPPRAELLHVMPADLGVARAVRRIARDQNGAVSTEQLRAAGLTRHAIAARVHRGLLVPAFHGTYLLGDPELMPLARPSAALLSLGPTAVVSHRSAAAVWDIAKPDPMTIDITIVGCNRRARSGVRLHRVSQLRSADITTHDNLRLTSPPRTLIDFAVQASTNELADAFGDARARGLLTDAKLDAALGRAPSNHPGAAIIRAMLSQGATYERSKAERIMRTICGEAGLPQPRVNIRLHGFLVDFLWPDAKLIVEVDGYGTHGNRGAFEADRRRDQIHAAAGYAVIRITWHQLQGEPLAVIARLAQALAHRAA